LQRTPQRPAAITPRGRRFQGLGSRRSRRTRRCGDLPVAIRIGGVELPQTRSYELFLRKRPIAVQVHLADLSAWSLPTLRLRKAGLALIKAALGRGLRFGAGD
jgi:hypothetical protein